MDAKAEVKEVCEIMGHNVFTECAKQLLNGPCGGVRDGKCEVNEKPCVWLLIYGKMLSKGKLGEFTKTRLPKSMETK